MTDYKAAAAEILKQMNLREKLECLGGTDSMYIRPLWRFGIRSIRMADASLGLRDNRVPATAFPATIALAATWDTELAGSYGGAVAEEFNAAGIDVLLGPGVNMYRVPQCGRNFEYMGEDPYLTSRMVVEYIKAVQDRGVAATVKHFACNNTDWHRKASNSIVDERTMREIYLPAFEAAIKEAGSFALMTAYNKVNGEYAAENQDILQRILLDEWEFDGLIMSDWNSVWDPEKTLKSPLHLEMPTNTIMNPGVVKSYIDSGKISQEDVDKKVRKVLEFALRMIDERQTNIGKGKYRCQEHLDVALQTSRQGTVLLKNDGVLPLKDVKSIAVVGPHAEETPAGGGGAALVKAVDSICLSRAFAETATGVDVRVGEDAVADADVVVVCLGLNPTLEGEFFDRPFELPADQLALFDRVAAANENIVLVITAGGGVDLSSLSDASRAVLHQWYPGENGSIAAAEIVMGLVNPSGKLPISIERQVADRPASANYLPEGAELYRGTNDHGPLNPITDVVYKEGVMAGYRHFVGSETKALYEFGYGLSFTTFEYKDLQVNLNGDQATVSLQVANTGDMDGAEVVQIYVSPVAPSVERPLRELKGFARVEVAAGQTRDVTINLDARAFSYYDVNAKQWTVDAGEYKIQAAASSEDIRLEATCKL